MYSVFWFFLNSIHSWKSFVLLLPHGYDTLFLYLDIWNSPNHVMLMGIGFCIIWNYVHWKLIYFVSGGFRFPLYQQICLYEQLVQRTKTHLACIETLDCAPTTKCRVVVVYLQVIGTTGIFWQLLHWKQTTLLRRRAILWLDRRWPRGQLNSTTIPIVYLKCQSN